MVVLSILTKRKVVEKLKKTRKSLLCMGIASFLFLAACGNSADESHTINTPVATNAPTREPEKAPTIKETYLRKINDTKKQVEGIREKSKEDTSTYGLKKVEDDRYHIWDELLNEIYGELQAQLPLDAMEKLKNEEIQWITYRDASAKEASLPYQGKTQEHLEYVTVQANLTEQRCLELLEYFIK